jgi:hypothetical protein
MNVHRMRALMLAGAVAVALAGAAACGRGTDESADVAQGPEATDTAETPVPEGDAGQPAGPPSDVPTDRYAQDTGTRSGSTSSRTTTGRTGAGRGAWDAPMESTSEQPTRTGGTVMRSVPAGQELEVVLLDDLSSAISKAGDSFRARLARDVVADGGVALPSGTVVRGSVVEAVPLNPKIGGRAKLVLDFDRFELPSGETVPMSAQFEEIGKSETAKDAATIAGATAGGAILGRILKDEDRKKGTLIGAVVGAATGTAIAARTEGQEVQMVSGTAVTLKLTNSVTVPVRL